MVKRADYVARGPRAPKYTPVILHAQHGVCTGTNMLQIWSRAELYCFCLFRDIPAELSGVSVKELVKAIGESRANGNGVTPPDTPRRSASPRSAPSPKVLTRSSSPIAIPGNYVFQMYHNLMGTLD